MDRDMVYPWARSFIKQARWFALLLVICGLIFVAIDAWNLRNQIQEKAYRPKAEVAESLQDVSTTLKKSREIISIFQQSTGGALIPPTIESSIVLLPAYDSVAKLSVAGDQLAKAKAIVNSLKGFLVTSVEQQLNDLVAQLRAHAATLTPTVAPNSNAPANPPQVTVQPGLRGLFAEEVTSDEVERKKAQLHQVQDLLAVLSQRTEKPENQAKLQSSLSEVRRLEGLLAYLTVPAALTITPASLQPSTEPSTPQEPVAASKVADNLQASESIIEDAILSKWLIDDKISAAEPIIIREQNAAEEAAKEITMLWVEFYENVFKILLVTCILAYLVQIAADILQAHIDNADNSFPQYQPPTDTEPQ